MSLENELKKNTAALIELTNALAARSEKGTSPAPSPEPAQASPAASAPASEPEADVFGDSPAAPNAGDPAPATPEPAPAAAAPEASTEVYSKDQVIKAIVALAKARGRDVATQMMAEFGHKKASEFNDAAQYPAVMAKVAELSK